MNGQNEFDLFRETMTDVQPMQHDTVETEIAQHEPTEAQLARQLSAQALSEGDSDALSLEHANMLKPEDVVSFKRPGVQDGVFRKLRLGKYDIHARLDIHKSSLDNARTEFLNFLRQCQQVDARTLVIVHGKGERTSPPAMLKSFICQWLEQIADIQCFHSAQRHHGGTGAVYVLLKKSQDKKTENRERHLHRRG